MNTYNRDYRAETPEGTQRPMLTVFHRDGETIRHFWSSELFYASTDPDQDPRHVGTLETALECARPDPGRTTTGLGEQLSYGALPKTRVNPPRPTLL
jgi:predicted dithiol-disulfide oxidoreductase (DUF899 family)